MKACFRGRGHHGRGIIGVEIIVSVALLAVLAVLAVDLIMDAHRGREQDLWRRSAAWAADGQLQRYQAGAPFDSMPPAGVLPEAIRLETRTEPGGDAWTGFSRVTVIATARMPSGREVREQARGYVCTEERP